MKRTLKITGLVSIILILIGSVLKFQHLPGAAVCLFSGVIIFSLVFLPLNIVLKFRDDKEKSSRGVMIFGLILGILGSVGVIFKLMHWPTANILFFGSFFIFFIVFIPVNFIIRYREPDTRLNAIVQTTFLVATCGMLFALVNLGPSRNIEKSVASLDDFQINNLKQMELANANLYAVLGRDVPESIAEFMDRSAAFKSQIRTIKATLIAHSNQVEVDEAVQMTTKDLKQPNDFNVIATYFEEGTDAVSYQGFKAGIETYNSFLREKSSLQKEGIVAPIELGDLQMTHTALSVVLHQLTDIEMQVLMNERATLNYHKGMLAMK